MESGSFLLRITNSGLSGQEMETAGVGGKTEVGVVRSKCRNHSRELNRLIIESGVCICSPINLFFSTGAMAVELTDTSGGSP